MKNLLSILAIPLMVGACGTSNQLAKNHYHLKINAEIIVTDRREINKAWRNIHNMSRSHAVREKGKKYVNGFITFSKASKRHIIYVPKSGKKDKYGRDLPNFRTLGHEFGHLIWGYDSYD